MDSVLLGEVQLERDLGLMVTETVRGNKQCNKATANADRVLEKL